MNRLVRLHLLDSLVRNLRQTELHLGLGEPDPELAPCAEAVPCSFQR